MEGLGAASSVAGLISLSGGILAKGYAFLASVHRAPQELRELLCEAATLSAVLNQLHVSIDANEMGAMQQGASGTVVGPRLRKMADTGVLLDCEESLLVVDSSTKRCQQIQGQYLLNLGKRIAWPFKEKETKESLARLGRFRGHLSAALRPISQIARDALSTVHKITQETAAGVAGLEDRAATHDQIEAHRKLIKWLDPHSINVEDNLQEGLKKRHPGTGDWLLEIDCYKSWANGSSSVLWIHGIPGSGKTVLASFIIERLLGHTASPSVGLIYFYCDHRDANKQTLQQFLASGILQLLSQKPELEAEVASVYQRRGGRGNKLEPMTLGDHLNLLSSMIHHFTVVYIAIDALDECKDVDEFVHQGLESIVNTEDVTIRLLCTGRNTKSLERTVGRLAAYRVALEQHITNDIETYVTDQVKSRVKARKLKVRFKALKDQIVYTLSHCAGGIFIWVTLQLDLISRLTTDKANRKALDQLPQGLNDTYIHILENLQNEHIENLEVIHKTLMRVVSSVVSLTLCQLAEAISVDLGDTRRDVEKIVNDENDVLELLGSLVIFDPALDDPVVSLAHFTLYNFFQSDILQTHKSLARFYISPENLMDIGLTCVQYLSFEDFNEPCCLTTALRERKASYKLLEFAATRFLHYMRSLRGQEPLIRRFLPMLGWFLEPCRDGQQNFLSWEEVYTNNPLDASLIACSSPDPLPYIVKYSMSDVVDVYLSRQTGAENQEPKLQKGFSTLHLAVITGREDRVAASLRANPNLEARAFRGRTALHLAAGSGHAGVVRLLLEAGASPHARNVSGSTPFYRAARGGSTAALDLLYEASSDIDAMTWDKWTPIFEAIERRHTAAVGWLIQKGVNLQQKLLNGESTLKFAKATGDEVIIEIIEKRLGGQRC